MPARLTAGVYAAVDARLAEADARVATCYPGEAPGRRPVHTVYVPASTFRADVVSSWGGSALAVLDRYGTDLADAAVLERVRAKLATEPIEDLRIDFEDGYGGPAGDVEDADAESAGRTLARIVADGVTPPFVGIRFKGFERATRHRGIRTLDTFLGALGTLPPGFVVTLPKVTAVEQVAAAADVLAELERAHGFATGALRFEVQVETAQSIVDTDGSVVVARIVQAAGGRCAGLHFGTYDYTAGLGISAAYQRMDHPAAEFAKQVMQVAVAGTGVRLSDGSTNRLPVGGRDGVLAGWAEHLRLVRRSLERGFYQGWDLHPHQLPSRFAATYTFFREALPEAAARLRAYAEHAGGSVLGVHDEPATAQALAAVLVRGVDCGALAVTEVTAQTGLEFAALGRYARRTA